MAALSGVRQRWDPAIWLAQGWARLRLVRFGWAQFRMAVGWAARMLLGFAAGFCSFATNALLALTLAGGALSWRLGTGPLDVTLPARAILRPAGIEIGQATVRWAAADHEALSVAVTSMAGLGISTGAADITLGKNALGRGAAEPFDITLAGLQLHLQRSETGQVELPGLPSGAGGGDPTLGGLRHVRLTDAVVTLDDARFGTIEARGTLDATRTAAGFEGAAQLAITQGGITAGIGAIATVRNSATTVALTVDPVELGTLLASVPHVAGTGGVLGGTAQLTLSPALDPVALRLDVSLGPGRGPGQVVLDGVPVRVERLSTTLTARWDPGDRRPAQIGLTRVTATVAAASGARSTAELSGQLTRVGEQMTAAGTLRLDRMALADLSQFWPEPWGGHARPWIVENIVGGVAHDGVVTVAGRINTDGSALLIDQFVVRLLGDDLSIAWLRPVPPVQHARAILTMAGPDLIEVSVPTARQGAIALQNGRVRITGLTVKDQNLSVVAEIPGGSVPDVLSLLKHPRLHLLSDHPIPIERPAGTVRNRLEVTLPLDEDLQIEQVGIHANGQISDLRLGGVVAGRDLDRGAIGFDVTQDGLRASGEANLAGVPSRVAVTMDFRAGPPGQVTQTTSVQGRATPRQLAAAGLDVSRALTGGTIGIAAQLTEREKQGTTITVQADLREAQIRLPSWRKEPGSAANASATLLVQDEHLVGINAIHAEGPALWIDARAEMQGDQPSQIVVSRLDIGSTRAAGVIGLPLQPGAPLRVQLAGSMLDLTGEFGGGGAMGAGKTDPLVADLRFGTVVLAGGARFTDVNAQGSYDGKTLRSLRLQTAGPERLQVVLVPQEGGRKLSVRIADTGRLLRALDLTSSLVGGSLAVEAQYDDRDPVSPLAGTIDLSDFHVRDAPVVGKLLQAVSVYGIPEAVSGPGLKFTRLIAPFVYSGQTFYLGESQAYSTSLGLTAKGTIDLRNNMLDLTGTVVPFYALNSAPGRVPLLGKLFSPETGSGLFAITFGVHGPAAQPSILVNPLSVVTPGLARRLFRLFN